MTSLVAFPAFFALGLSNNIGYVVVSALADPMMKEFGKLDLIGLVTLAMGIGTVLVSASNLFMTSLSMSSRVVTALACSVLGALLLTLTIQAVLSASIVAIILISCASSFGEIAILSSMSRFPDGSLGMWTAGTGAAGILGTAFALLTKSAGADLRTRVSIGLFPAAALFALCYPLAKRSADQDPDAALAHKMPARLTTTRVAGALRSAWVHIGNVAWMYFVVAAMHGLPASRCQALATSSAGKQPSWAVQHSLEILILCMQSGIFVARSSLSFVTIRRFSLILVPLTATFALFVAHVRAPFMPLEAQFALMGLTGLLSGATYANALYDMTKRYDNPIPIRDQPLCVTLAGTGGALAAVLSSVLQVVAGSQGWL